MRYKYEARVFLHSYTEYNPSTVNSLTETVLYDLADKPWELDPSLKLQKESMTAILKPISRDIATSAFAKSEIYYGVMCVFPAPLNFSALYLREGFTLPTTNLRELTIFSSSSGKVYTEIISSQEIDKVDQDFFDKLDSIRAEKGLEV